MVAQGVTGHQVPILPAKLPDSRGKRGNQGGVRGGSARELSCLLALRGEQHYRTHVCLDEVILCPLEAHTRLPYLRHDVSLAAKRRGRAGRRADD